MGWKELKPTGANVLVRLHPKQETIGSLHIPDDFRRQQETGDIIAVGPRAPSDCKPGMVAVIGKYNGTQLPARDGDDGEYVMLNADHEQGKPFWPDLYAVVDDAPEDIAARVSSDAPRRKPCL